MIGIVVSGKKEGRKFISLEEYRRQFKEKLKIDPFPGTLNILSKYSMALKKIDGITINGFVENGIEYGSVKCFPVKIKKIKAAIIIPEKANNDYVEVVSKYKLRDKFSLTDGDKIKINFIPFIKRRRKIFLDCSKNEGKIKIYYGNPLIDDSFVERCHERKGGKVLPSAIVASLIFEKNERENFKKLVGWIEKRYAVMYPPVLIDYGMLKEWQLEIKWNSN